MKTIVERFIKNNKKYKIIRNIPSENRDKKVVLFITGYKAEASGNQTNDQIGNYEQDIAVKLSNANQCETITFDWFCSSSENNDIKNILIEEYVDEIETIVNYISEKIEFEILEIITNSFGSLPTFVWLENSKNQDMVSKVVFRGAIFENILPALKWRVNGKNRFIYELIEIASNGNIDKRNEIRDWIYEKHAPFMDENFFKFKKWFGKCLVVMGGDETYDRLEVAENFSKRNEFVSFHILEYGAHNPIKTDRNEKVEEITSKLENEFMKIID